MPHSTIQTCGAEKQPLKRKSPQKRLQSVSESLRLFCSNRICAFCGMLHNAESDLCETEIRCASRLYIKVLFFYNCSIKSRLIKHISNTSIRLSLQRSAFFQLDNVPFPNRYFCNVTRSLILNRPSLLTSPLMSV